MSPYLTQELVLFFLSVWQGIFLMLVYDALRIFRKICPHRKGIVSMEDVCYWIFAAFYLFTRFYRETRGSLRGFLFIGIFGGMAVWKASLSEEFVRVGVLTLRRLWHLLKRPFLLFRKKGKSRKEKVEFSKKER